MWTETLNLAGVLAALEWRKAENIYYPPDIHEASVALIDPGANFAPAPTAPEQPSTTQVSLPPSEVSKGPIKASDHGKGVEDTKGKGDCQGGSLLEEKGKGNEAKPLPEAKGPKVASKPKYVAPNAKDVALKTKEVDPQSKEANPKATGTFAS